ncbi:MAG: sugar transferase [Lachnospiraceae bacterium]|nr:sugar transferase [Lachnospiraceae bacterium]
MYKRNAGSFVKHLDFLILDILSLILALLLAIVTRFGGLEVIYPAPQYYREVAGIAVCADILVLFALRTFSDVLKRGIYQEFVKTLQQAIGVELGVISGLYLMQRGIDMSRSIMVYLPLYYIALSYISRLIWKRVLKVRKPADRKLLVITQSSMADEVLENTKTGEYQFVLVAGFVFLDKDMSGEEACGVPVVANRDNMMEYICYSWVDEVLVALPQGSRRPAKLMQKLSEAGVTSHLVVMTSDSWREHNEIMEQIGRYIVLTDAMNNITWSQALIKRLMDIAGGLVGCIITLILYLFLAPAIKKQSPGPVLFSQERIGRNGRTFKIYKFRSMYMDAEERKKELEEQNRIKDGMMFKLEFDPRVIGNQILPDGTYKRGLGDFIRRTSLDEFPQFFNVLKGDMSLVGTRPPTLDEWEKYALHHRARMSVKPGITGMWQVNGRSNIVDFEEVVRLDTEYIRSWS